MNNSFAQYKEKRELQDFDAKFSSVCENIARSGLSFEQFWTECGLPIVLESEKHLDETGLLNEFLGIQNWKNSTANPGNWFGGNQGVSWSGNKATNPNDPFQKGLATMGQQKADAAAAQQAAQQAAMQQRLQQYQGQVDKAIPIIKQQFAQAMRAFLKQAGDTAMKANDKIAYLVAQKFYNQIMQTAQPVIDKFALQAKQGQSPETKQHLGNFGKGVAGMQQANQAAIKARAPGPAPIPMPGAGGGAPTAAAV